MANGGESFSDAQLIAQLEQQLRHAQKLTALGELMSTTTHEFNNVLTTIINYAKLGLRNRDEATRTKSFEKILAAGQRAARITTGILGFARNRSGEREPTDLARIVDDTLLLVERDFVKYRIALEKQIGDVPPAMVNGNQIQQVLLNLVINARQAMSAGGQLTIKLSHDAAAGLVDLVVRDTGCGIPPDRLPRIFDRYFSTKAGPDETGQGGSGLGLSLCKEVMEAHGGRLRVESTVGKGTAFTLRLPAAGTPAAGPALPALLGSPQTSAPNAPASS